MTSLSDRCRPIELILSDIDGVLTDGTLVYDSNGCESKRFSIRDGQGIRLWQAAGHRFGLATLRTSEMVRRRAEELNIRIVCQGLTDKGEAVRQVLAEQGLRPDQLCYIGDDLPDIPAARAAGLGVAVADACPELLEAADHITRRPGGSGAVRELIETILKAQDRWTKVIAPYT